MTTKTDEQIIIESKQLNKEAEQIMRESKKDVDKVKRLFL